MFDGYGTWHCDRSPTPLSGGIRAPWEIEALRFYSSVSRTTRSTATVYDVTMASTEVDDTGADAVLPLTIRVMGETHRVDPEHAPVIIGRPDPGASQEAHIRIADSRVSRQHIVVDVRRGHWVGEATGRNGTFIDGREVSGEFDIPDDGLTATLGHPVGGIQVHFTTLDPAMVYVGAQVAKRRSELDLSQRKLAENKIINAGTLIAFEKGRSWPREATRTRLEEALGWPPGEIARLRRQFGSESAAGAEPAQTVDDGERTVMLETGGTTTVDSKYMAETVAMALDNITKQVDVLPAPSAPAFQASVKGLIADLSRLEALATNASRGSSGAEDIFRALSAVRRARRGLLLRAAESPHATVGQRLFAARHRAELSVEEAATMAGLTPNDIAAAEAGNAVAPAQFDALNRLLAALQQ
jgi:transcriptional regulator with XRE-family HTH domain